MTFRYSKHALEEMERRSISKKIVESVLKSPGQKIPEYSGRTAFQSKVSFKGKVYLVRVIVDENINPPLVITIYRTTKISRYWS